MVTLSTHFKNILFVVLVSRVEREGFNPMLALGDIFISQQFSFAISNVLSQTELLRIVSVKNILSHKLWTNWHLFFFFFVFANSKQTASVSLGIYSVIWFPHFLGPIFILNPFKYFFSQCYLKISSIAIKSNLCLLFVAGKY